MRHCDKVLVAQTRFELPLIKEGFELLILRALPPKCFDYRPFVTVPGLYSDETRT